MIFVALLLSCAAMAAGVAIAIAWPSPFDIACAAFDVAITLLFVIKVVSEC